MAIFDSNEDTTIEFGRNRILDLADGSTVTIRSETGATIRSLEFDGVVEQDGAVYFIYSRVGSAAGVAEFIGE
jgi:hypothetical protein